MRPDFQVYTGIAGIVKAALTMTLQHCRKLVAALEIAAGIAGKYTREAAEVPGDSLCEFLVGGGCQVEFAVPPGLAAQVFQELGMVRQDFDVDIDALRNLLLEPGTAPQQPERDQEEIKRIAF